MPSLPPTTGPGAAALVSASALLAGLALFVVTAGAVFALLRSGRLGPRAAETGAALALSSFFALGAGEIGDVPALGRGRLGLALRERLAPRRERPRRVRLAARGRDPAARARPRGHERALRLRRPRAPDAGRVRRARHGRFRQRLAPDAGRRRGARGESRSRSPSAGPSAATPARSARSRSSPTPRPSGSTSSGIPGTSRPCGPASSPRRSRRPSRSST